MTTPTVTYESVVERITLALSVPRELVTPDTLLSDIGTDSLAMVEMAVDLQEEFDVILSQDEFAQIGTVGDLVTILRSRQ